MMTILTDNPAMRDFNRIVRLYWKQNVKRYFSKREQQYGLNPKTNHRFIVSPYSDSREPRIRNALIINWTPESNHITVKVAPIMVKSVSVGKKMKTGTKYGNNRTTSSSPQRAYDLIEILRKGTRTTRKAYIVSLDARISKGSRGAQMNDQWITWFRVFLSKIDQELEVLATKLEQAVAEEF